MKNIFKYAGVIVDVKITAVDKIFHYRIPKNIEQLRLGHRVLVPFGKRQVEGYVVELVDEVDLEPERIKNIIKPLDLKPILTEEQLEVAKWMAEEYIGLYSQALQFFLPAGTRYGRERVSKKKQLVVTLSNLEMLPIYLEKLPKNAVRQRAVLMSLNENPQQLASELCAQTKANYQTLNALRDKGYIELESKVIERKIQLETGEEEIHTLNQYQVKALEEIINQMKKEHKPVLVHGVTGSGKTEVYLHSIKHCLNQGRQAVMLVPEIALTAQTIARFTQRFPDRIAVLHSGLSEGERYDQWHKIYNGEVDIVIGARSAVFAPFHNIGLIILDEEHETTYKQEDGMLKYHTRGVAMKRAAYHEAVVILGSATPSIESYHRALRGDYKLVELPYRVNHISMPKISVVDMRSEFAKDNRSMFSRQLSEALEDTLSRQEQAIIFINRRGYSSFVLCRECGYVIECRNCQVSLKYHQVDNSLKCHYCGYRQKLPTSCPNCASHYLRQFGSGTQQVEQYVKQNFSQAKTVRLDADSARIKGAHSRILNRFKNQDANVLIGTQMIAKGLDFPNVTLVGVLSADLTLNFPDFRASEHTFQLLTQVSGRAGRDIKLGRVIIQCYDPAHYAIKAVQKQDYLSFYRQEITFRRQLNYPPFGHLVRILVQGPEMLVERKAEKVFLLLNKRLKNAQVFNPAPAPIPKIKGRYRWQIIIKSREPINNLLDDIPQNDQDVVIDVDCEPLFLL